MFQYAEFEKRVKKANPQLSRFTKSSLEPLMKQLEQVRNVANPAQKKAIQEEIFKIPHDRHQKYKDALAYLTQTLGVKVCARPSDPTMELAYFAAGEFLYEGINSNRQMVLSSSHPGYVPVHSYHHVFDIKWKSSNGNPASLAQVGTREHVKFRTQPGGPPFNQNLADTPIEFFHGVSTTGANTCLGRDDHMTKPPALICSFPLQPGELVADQWYQYTIDNGATWENIPGAAYNIIKGVRKSGADWIFYFAKKNWFPHNTKPFHFEVEYKIHPPMPPAKPGSRLNRANGVQANITQYAHRVLRMQ